MAKTLTKRRRPPTLAQQADKYALYLRSVQEPEIEVRFFDRTYRNIFKAGPRVLREDFCAAAAICYEWVKPGYPHARERRAIGVDLDPEPLKWGIEHIASELTPEVVDRVSLLQQDVRKVAGPKADVLSAQNFSFWIFKTRAEVRDYFRAALKNLADRGIMVLDMMGGSMLWRPHQEDVKRYRHFRYIWEQVRLDPLTHDALFRIHFRFPDGSEIKNAFEYDWRLWTIPEVCELLLEAGFDDAAVYWEDANKDGEGTGTYRRRTLGTNDPAWVAYIIGIKGPTEPQRRRGAEKSR